MNKSGLTPVITLLMLGGIIIVGSGLFFFLSQTPVSQLDRRTQGLVKVYNTKNNQEISSTSQNSTIAEQKNIGTSTPVILTNQNAAIAQDSQGIIDVEVLGGYSPYTETASLTLHITDPKTKGSYDGLTISNFSVHAQQVGPGGCEVWPDPKYPLNNRGDGIYIMYLITHGTTQGCTWHAGEYIVSVKVHWSGSGTGLGKFSVPTTGRKVYLASGETTSTPSYIPATPVVNWTIPTGSLSIVRGENIPLGWNLISGNANSKVYFSLISSSSPVFDVASFDIHNSTGVMKINSPPGEYLLKLGYPNTIQKTIPVTVIGDVPSVSYQSSTVDFDSTSETSSEIISDGVCSDYVIVGLVDAFGIPIKGKRAGLISSRPISDSILPQSLYTDENGELYFKVLSQVPGTSTLTAIIEGISLPPLTLSVLDKNDNDCETDSSGYDGY